MRETKTLQEALHEMGFREQKHFDQVRNVLAEMFQVGEILGGKVQTLEKESVQHGVQIVDLLTITSGHEAAIEELAQAIANSPVSAETKVALTAEVLLSPCVDGDALLDRLRKESEAIFRLVVRYASPPAGTLHGDDAPLSTRALDLIQWAEKGPGLGVVYKAYKRVTQCPPCGDRSSTDIDRDLGSVPAPIHIDIARLPRPRAKFFDRQRGFQILDKAWSDPDIRIVVIVGFAGLGKSELVHHWLRQVENERFRGARRVFAWSFYSQGTTEDTASANPFVNSALRFFGDPDPKEGNPWDKGERLASLIKQQPTLLILDGLEPLQWGPGPQHGQLKDRAGSMVALLRQLSFVMKGLCIVSSRVDVNDLDWSDSAGPVRRINLEQLPTDAGRKLLRDYGVTGADDDLNKAVEEYGGHALSLALLAEYLVDFLGCDIAMRDRVPLSEQETPAGHQAFRVMEAYDTALGRDGREVERAILRLIGLFDRPASAGCLNALRGTPPIHGVTDALVALPEEAWSYAVGRLRKWGLLSQPYGVDDLCLDAHPLVREYFCQKLEWESLCAVREAHGRLYEHLRDTTERFPATIEDMEYLFQAVRHGCRAGRHAEALNKVYKARIQHGDEEEPFSTFVLGAISSELAVLSGYFNDRRYSSPVANLDKADRAFVLSEAGFDLQGVGRLRDAVQPLRMSLELYRQIGRWDDAIDPACTLVDVFIKMGDLRSATQAAEESMVVSQHCDDLWEQVAARTDRATVLHRQGRLSESRAAFEEAECFQQTHARERGQYLRSLQGAQYCALLLDLGEVSGVRERSQLALRHARRTGDRLDMGYAHAGLGSTFHLLSVASGVDPANGRSQKKLSVARRHLDDAVDCIRGSGSLDELPRTLLVRAAFLCDIGERDEALRDLGEVLQLSKLLGLRLDEVDARLLDGHLHLDEDTPCLDMAEQSLARAKHLIIETGYHLRDPDILILEGRLLGKQGHTHRGRALLTQAIDLATRGKEEGVLYLLAAQQAERCLKETGVR